MDEDELNRRLGEAHACGIRAGMEKAAKIVLSAATAKFCEGHDEDAKYLRKLSEGIQADAAKEYQPPVLPRK
jgi:hypothetical protein